MDLIPGKIEPVCGSIKTIIIDGLLSEKHIYDGKRWNTVCRYLNCTDNPSVGEFCQKHHHIQLRDNVEGELVVKGNKTYRWTVNEWKLLCSINFCDNYATSNGLCKAHIKNKPILYSSNLQFSNLYNRCKQDILIAKQKKKKLGENKL